MDRDKLELFTKELTQTKGQERTKVLSMLRAKAAGALETLHKGHEAGPYWLGINSDLESIVNTDPADAFKFATETLELKSIKEDPDRYYAWLKGNALIILSNEKVRPFLVESLKSKDSPLLPALESLLNYKTPETVQTIEDLSDYPQSFNLVMSCLVIHSLKDENLDSTSRLKTKYEGILKEEHFKHLVELYHEIPDDKELVDPLFQLIRNSK